MRELIAKEARTGVKRDKRRQAAVSRVRKGLLKARIMGANVGGTASQVKAQRLRYGRVRRGYAARGDAPTTSAARMDGLSTGNGLAALGL